MRYISPIILLLASGLALAAGGAPTPGPSDAAPPPDARVDTARAFHKGDLLVAATVMNDPADDHAGVGRLLQYDADLHYVGELWLKGSTHKVGGLTFAPDGALWAMAQLTPIVMEIGRDARQKPVRRFSDHKYSSVTFARDGSLYFCDHMVGEKTGVPMLTTKFPLLPGENIIGNGHIFHHAADGTLLREYHNEVHGGLMGILGCTSTVLADRDTRMIYVSETGNRVMQYDLVHDRQLPDLHRFEGDPAVPMVIVMNRMPDGKLIISYGAGFMVMDPKTGEVIKRYPLPVEGRPGWAAVNAAADGKYAFTANFWTGELLKVRLKDGEIVGRVQTGQKKSVSGIAQFPG